MQMIHEVELLCDFLLRFCLCWSDTSLFAQSFLYLAPLDGLPGGIFGGAKELGVSSGGNVAGLRAVNLVEIARRLPLSP